MNEDKINVVGNELALIIRETLIEQIPIGGSVASKILSLEERIKQKRINSFFEEWIAYLLKIDKTKIDWERLSRPEFIDSIISVSHRVYQTSSKEKLQRFKLILTGELIKGNISKTEFKDTFLDILLRINEDQINVLKAYKKIHDEKIGMLDERCPISGIPM